MTNNLQHTWTLSTIKQFLSIVEKFPAIWNESHIHFKQESVKAKYFQAVIKLMKQPTLNEISARKMFQSIRDAVVKRLYNIQCLDEEQQAAELQKSYFPKAKYLVDMYKAKFKDRIAQHATNDPLDLPGSSRPHSRCTAAFYWTEENSRRLLKSIERYPAIWNPKSIEVSIRRQSRVEALQNVCDEFSLDCLEDFGPEVLLKKFDNLRDNVYSKIRSGRTKEFSKGYYPAAQYLIDFFISKNPQFSLKPTKGLVEWNLQLSIKLLNLISKHPCIWQEDHPEHQNEDVRTKAFQSVCNKMKLTGYDAKDLQKKYEIIRSRVDSKLCQLRDSDDIEKARITKEFEFGYFPAAEFLMKEYDRVHSSKNEPLTDEDDIQTTVGEFIKCESGLAHQASLIQHSTCRICLKPSDGTFMSIFDAEYQRYGQRLDDIFQQTTNYTVTTDQPFYPASLCGACEQELLQSYLFKAKCEKTEEFLEQLYNCQTEQEANELYSSRSETKTLPMQEMMQIDPSEQFKSEIDEMENFEDEYTNKLSSETSLKQDEQNKLESDFIVVEYTEEVYEETIDQQISEPNVLEENNESNFNDEEEIDEKNYESNFNDEEEIDEVDDETLELQISEQLHILESSSNLANYRVPEEKLSCEYCGKLMTVQTLKSHIAHVHAAIPPRLQCDLCSGFFKGKRSLRSHMRTKHFPLKRLYKCRYCDNISGSFCTRRYHERLQHEEGDLFTCAVCDKPFITAKRLENHMVVHSDERNYECSGCDKRFKKESQRNAHYQEYHTGILQQCQYCDQEFRTKKQRRIHIRRDHVSELENKRREQENMEIILT